MEYRTSIHGIEDTWNEYTKKDIFLQSQYLKVLEDHPPQGMQFRYVCIMENSKPIGVLYYQIINLKLTDILQDKGARKSITSKISASIKSGVASCFETHLLILGNTLVTGDYGYHFSKPLANSEINKIMDFVTDKVREQLVSNGIKVGVNLKKDFFPVQIEGVSDFNKYTKFEVQPNMWVHLKEEWKTFDDYLDAMKSKYRVRMRRARKKSADLVKRELSLEELKEINAQMYQQYLETVKGAGFNLFYLHNDYNIALKESFNTDFKVIGYFTKEQNQEKLIGYFTIFSNYDQMEAHFLGYDHSENAQYQTYLNFLFDMIDHGIEGNFKAINLSRTAMEIKSSVGAVAYDLSVFLKYNTSWINKFVPKALDYFITPVEWKPRSPFK